MILNVFKNNDNNFLKKGGIMLSQSLPDFVKEQLRSCFTETSEAGLSETLGVLADFGS
jgi:hypothetical protein